MVPVEATVGTLDVGAGKLIRVGTAVSVGSCVAVAVRTSLSSAVESSGGGDSDPQARTNATIMGMPADLRIGQHDMSGF